MQLFMHVSQQVRVTLVILTLVYCLFHSRFDHEMVFELPNEISKNVPLKGKYMHFLSTECVGKSHNLRKDGCGKVEIHSFARSVCPPPQEIGTESGS